MHLLAETDASQVTPAMMGMVVIILMQLAQFFFAWRKDMRGTESAKKEDLTALKNDIHALRVEMKETIRDVSNDLEELKHSVETKMETSRAESSRSRNDLYIKINEGATKTAELLKGMAITEQTLISLGSKFDALRMSNNNSMASYRKVTGQ